MGLAHFLLIRIKECKGKAYFFTDFFHAFNQIKVLRVPLQIWQLTSFHGESLEKTVPLIVYKYC